MRLSEAECPSFFDHTPCPPGYIQWHEWARKMSKTHRQIRCTGCGLYTIWIPREAGRLSLQEAKMRLSEAIAIAVDAHRGQVDKAGQPYILHPLRVMLAMQDETDRIVAVLHDVVEDSDKVDFDDIMAWFGEDVCAAVDALTRRKETYADFIKRCDRNEIARRVKLADIADNLAPDRLSSISGQQIERYLIARASLQEERE